MPTSPLDATATFAAPAEFLVEPGAGAGFDEELRRLLRSRLILVHLLFLGYVALLAVLGLAVPSGGVVAGAPSAQGAWWHLGVPAAQCLLGAVVLWRSPGMSLRSLRLWELACFAVQAANQGFYRYADLAHLGVDRSAPDVEIGFTGLYSLQGFVTLILAYGVLVPNTRRRSLAVVAALAAVPLAAILAAVAVNLALREGGHLRPLVMQWALIMLFPAAIAVAAAARATALQRRAFEAERRAERVGQYALRHKLGEGGMGEVWLAEHALLKRPCAVKFVRPELAASPAVAARFAREVQAVTGLTHVNTVRVYDYGRADDGSFYYVMEYLDGPTLDRLVRDHGPLPPGRVVYLLRQLCGALAEAHAAGLVHRDVKPGNVIVARLGGACDVAKLLDFGLVLDESAAGGGDRLTRAGAVLGTPAYMPPEQAAGDPADARADVYGLGALGYYALTGRPPFEGKTARQTLAAVLTEPVPPPGGPADLAAVVSRCLARCPADRFGTVQELDRALAGCGCSAEWSAEQAASWWAGRVGEARTVG